MTASALAEELSQLELGQLLERTRVVEDCAGCATFYCRDEPSARRHWPARRELLGSDADGMDVFCIVFLDADGIWGADIYRADGDPWLAMPDLATFQPVRLRGGDRP